MELKEWKPFAESLKKTFPLDNRPDGVLINNYHSALERFGSGEVRRALNKLLLDIESRTKIFSPQEIVDVIIRYRRQAEQKRSLQAKFPPLPAWLVNWTQLFWAFLWDMGRFKLYEKKYVDMGTQIWQSFIDLSNEKGVGDYYTYWDLRYFCDCVKEVNEEIAEEIRLNFQHEDEDGLSSWGKEG